MPDARQIEARREQILNEMRSIRCLCRGSLTEQFLESPRPGAEPVKHGPYYVLSWRESGRTKSRRVPREEVAVLRSHLLERERFAALCREFEALTEQLGQFERAAFPLEKKLHPSRSSATTI
jgi:hypothetical protein